MRTNAMRAVVVAFTIAALSGCAQLGQRLAEASLTCAGAQQVVDTVCQRKE